MRLLAFMLPWLPVLACADQARVEGGNVFLDRPGAAPRQMTALGRDRDAQLSADGRWVVFIRESATVPGGSGLPLTELRVVHVDDGVERVLATSGQACGTNPRLEGLAAPQFLSDSRRIVFESQFVATSGSVQLTTVQGGGCRFVAAANAVQPVRAGEYRDDLVLNQHRYFLAGGSYDWYWLFTIEGREIGVVGADEDAVERFLDEAAGGGEGV